MIIPTKHENLEKNPMVLGADILFFLRNSDLTIEELYQKLKTEKNVNLDVFYDTVTFLWIIESISFFKGKISKNKNVSQ